jgi:hypothetical protein
MIQPFTSLRSIGVTLYICNWVLCSAWFWILSQQTHTQTPTEKSHKILTIRFARLSSIILYQLRYILCHPPTFSVERLSILLYDHFFKGLILPYFGYFSLTNYVKVTICMKLDPFNRYDTLMLISVYDLANVKRRCNKKIMFINTFKTCLNWECEIRKDILVHNTFFCEFKTYSEKKVV